MKANRIIAVAMSFALISGTVPCYSGGFTQNAVTVNSADEVQDVLTGMKTVSSSNASVYSGNKISSFNMSGRTYYQGVVFSRSYSGSPEISFDVSDINTVSWTMGHVDGADRGSAKLQVYVDDSLEDSIQLTSYMSAEDYLNLDVSGATTLKLVLETSNSCSYALGDISTDKEGVNAVHAVPEYKNMASMLESGFDKSYVTTYLGNNKSESFNMSGRTFYEGVSLKGQYYTDSTITFNVENISAISWKLGHIDGADRENGELNIYIDNEKYETYPLTWTMELTDCDIKIPSGSKTIRFELSNISNMNYGLGDIKADSLEIENENLTPSYSKISTFIDSGFDTSYITNYAGSSKGLNYNVNGRTYYEGVEMSGNYYSKPTIAYNVENINKMSFTVGRVADSGVSNAKLHIYLDNVEYETLPLTPYMDIMDYELELADIKNVRFILEPEAQCSYALMNISVDELSTEIDYAYPKYEKVSNMLDKYFNYSSNYVKVLNGSTKADSFKMNGRTYYQGVELTSTSHYNNSTVSFNVEDVNTFSYTLGHIDTTDFNKATLYIYLDDVIESKTEISSNMVLTPMNIDVTDAKVIRFNLEREDGGSGFALANVKADDRIPAIDCVIPVYDSPKQFLGSAYAIGGVEIYDGSSPKVYNFNMRGTEYTQGIILKGTSRYAESYARFNTENVNSISFKLGHVDETDSNEATLYIYKDGKQADTVALTPDMDIETYTIDTADTEYIQLYLNRKNGGSSYAAADFTIESSNIVSTTTTTTAKTTTTTTTAVTTTTKAATTTSGSTKPATTTTKPVTTAPTVSKFETKLADETVTIYITADADDTNCFSYDGKKLLWDDFRDGAKISLHIESEEENVVEISVEDVVITAPKSAESTVKTGDVCKAEIKLSADKLSKILTGLGYKPSSLANLKTECEVPVIVFSKTAASTPPASTGKFGDINGDGVIDATDASALLTYYAKSSTGYEGTLEDFIAEME